MRPVPEWRRVLRHAWSIRLILIAAGLDGLSTALSTDPYLLPLPAGLVSLAAGLASSAALASRFIAQKDLSK